MLSSAGCSLLGAECFSCSLGNNILHRCLVIKIASAVKFYNSPDPEWIRIRDLKPWIRIRIEAHVDPQYLII
jgi:hypothetical protein